MAITFGARGANNFRQYPRCQLYFTADLLGTPSLYKVLNLLPDAHDSATIDKMDHLSLDERVKYL